MGDIRARIERLQEQEKEVRARFPSPAKKKLGRPPKDTSGPAVARRRHGAAYVRTSFCVPLWAYEGILECEARGLGGSHSAVLTAALQVYFERHGIGVLVPVGPPLPAKPGEPPTRLYMPKKARKV